MDRVDFEARRALLINIASAIGDNADRLPDEPLVGFAGMHGREYDGDLMWVGRALNGWRLAGRKPSEYNADTIPAFVDEIIQSFDTSKNGDGTCPMLWVSDHWNAAGKEYNTARSAFWQAARRVALEISGGKAEGQTWPSRLIWSNLCRFSPESGGNPSNRLGAIQFELCRELLVQEIRHFRPRNLVFATGMNWASGYLDNDLFRFRSEKTVTWDTVAWGDIVIDNQVAGRFVVALHPQGVGTDAWSAPVLGALRSSA